MINYLWFIGPYTGPIFVVISLFFSELILYFVLYFVFCPIFVYGVQDHLLNQLSPSGANAAHSSGLMHGSSKNSSKAEPVKFSPRV